MNFMSALTDTLKPASSASFGSRMQQLAGSAFLAFSLNLPALAEKIEAVGQAKKEHPANPTLLAVFTGLNVVAGVAILATIVFSVIWFLQRRDEDEEDEEDEDELEEELEVKEASKAEAKPSESTEAKPSEGAESTEVKSAPEAAAEGEAQAKAEESESSAEKSQDADK